uniref:Transcription factor WRKY2 n=1 Tax=Lilium regale TaxID=82328 RepID=A0A894THB0_LILRE|nr:transcription factor WRKY2 [Lilium regale]
MCDLFWQRMEGELADIVRTSGLTSHPPISDFADWDLPSDPITFSPSSQDNFGDPFINLPDPLLHESPATNIAPVSDSDNHEIGVPLAQRMIAASEELKRPNNIFSRMLQISPRELKATQMISTSDLMKTSNSGSTGAVQISSPRGLGIKRRKSQAKKVVCIPAPAATTSRSSGEVVPADLWAWRKYGQKPIKGSPHPRGYYRCSSSKGCSARKQVERSRTDPNMLVITYTSEHNHPWPTQRNALAGSTRSSHPAKNISSAASKISPPANLKEEEPKEEVISTIVPVKEEMAGNDHQEFQDQVLQHTYKPMIPDSNQSDDFFDELGELGTDSMDSFNMFEWAGK